METVKLKCITPHGRTLTEGKIYNGVPSVCGEYFNVVNDFGNEQDYWTTRFEVVTETPATAEFSIGIKATQVGGDHYTKCKIQPWEYALANDLGPIESTVLKYITRWKDKNGLEDLKKAQHAIQYLIEYTESTQNG